MSYRLHGIDLERGGRVHDFEGSMFEVEVPIAPVRSIAITPEIIAADEANRLAREAGNTSDWTIKATLSEDNLRKRRVMVGPGRERIVPARPKARSKRVLKPIAPVAPSVAPQPSSKRSSMSEVAKFTIRKPVSAVDVPAGLSGPGRVSAYLPVMEALRKLGASEFLPIDFTNSKLSTNAIVAIRKLAENEKKGLEARRDGLTVYIRLTPLRPREQK